MKAVLVIDMPECCIGDCIFCEDRICDACYAKEHKPIFDDDFGNNEDDFNKRPDWCPLIPDYKLYIEPYDAEKHNQEIEDWLDEGNCASMGEIFAQIWNECVDRILGEVES